MTATTAPIRSATVAVDWQCSRGFDHGALVEVEYTFDGHNLKVLSARTLSEPQGISDYDLDELIDEAVLEHAIDTYEQED